MTRHADWNHFKTVRAESVTYVSGINRNLCVQNGPAIFGAPDRIRTCDLWNRNPTLYPAELRVHPFGGRAAEAGCERFLA